MSKELEALNKIAYSYGYDENIKIIATALEDYELMKQAKIIVADKKISDDDLENSLSSLNPSVVITFLRKLRLSNFFCIIIS